jgi:uncharacterized protein (TIGR02246 family)
MRYAASLFAPILLFATLLSFAGAQTASVEQEVKVAYAAWDEAFNKGDAKALAALYTPDAKLLPPSHDILEGPTAAEKFFSSLLLGGTKGHKLELIEADGDGKLVFAAAKWSATGKDTKGADTPWSGVATTIFEKQDDGSLKLRLHTFN